MLPGRQRLLRERLPPALLPGLRRDLPPGTPFPPPPPSISPSLSVSLVAAGKSLCKVAANSLGVVRAQFWQQCGDFLGGAQDLQSVSVMCAAQNPDMESHIAAGFCTLSQTANRKCHGACPHEGGHDREECESQRHCCAWNAGSGGGGH